MEPESIGSKYVVAKCPKWETGTRERTTVKPDFISFFEPLSSLYPFAKYAYIGCVIKPFPVGLFPRPGYSWAEGPHVEVINMPMPFSPTEFTDQRPCQSSNG